MAFKIPSISSFVTVKGGATMMAPNAAANLQEVALCIRHGLSVVEVASTPHPNGEWGELIRLAAKKLI